jgi:murein DD-endopeptidase MepM/ murein hydrolase activator NlpD
MAPEAFALSQPESKRSACSRPTVRGDFRREIRTRNSIEGYWAHFASTKERWLGILIPIAMASIGSATWAIDIDTHNGISWQQVVIPPKSDPCYVPTNVAYKSQLWGLGYEAFHDADGPAAKPPGSEQTGSGGTSSKGCVTFPYLGDPYDIDGSLKVKNWVHAGVDLRADTGDKVYAVSGGTVVWTNLCIGSTANEQAKEPLCKTPDGEKHSTVVLEDSRKTRKTFYLHMSEYAPKLGVGDKVCKSQYLGKAGSIGATAAHLHIEVWPNSATGYAKQIRALSGSFCPGKKPHKLADGSVITSYCVESDVRAHTIDPASPEESASGELKLGETRNDVEYRLVGADAVAMFRGKPIATCVAGSDFTGSREADLAGAISTSRVVVSPPSPTGKYVAVFCSALYSYGYELRIVDRTLSSVVKAISPSPKELFQALYTWISFSPNDHWAVLNQAGDEGNYAPIALDLTTGIGKTFAGPLIHEEQCPTEWTDAQTFRYRATQICDPEVNSNNEAPCKSVGIYEFLLDLPTTTVKSKRVADWDPH